MKFWFSYTISMILIGAFAALSYVAIFPDSYKTLTYDSPLPDFLTLGKNNQVTGLDLWSPILETFASTNGNPEIQARAALLYDLNDNKVLYEQNMQERMPMASLTKIMTAIVALEDPNMPETYHVFGEDLVGEDSMGLEAGEILSKKELLYGLMLNSGNDAAEVLAHNYSAGRTAFLTAMDNKAKSLGLSNTQFSNPSGLQGDGVQYTTAHDLLVMTQYALDRFPLFKEIVATYQHEIPATDTHKSYFLTNETNLISTYPGVKGVKTGYTPEAGMCLITYFERDNVEIVGILLNSPDRRGEMKTMLNYALSLYDLPIPEEQY